MHVQKTLEGRMDALASEIADVMCEDHTWVREWIQGKLCGACGGSHFQRDCWEWKHTLRNWSPSSELEEDQRQASWDQGRERWSPSA